MLKSPALRRNSPATRTVTADASRNSLPDLTKVERGTKIGQTEASISSASLHFWLLT
ncbi:hypothetical protein STRDD11_00742 [Streptococcus sp. DD11]|nr:hypothetical protein STRDD11_00742 [Streptococcus sp. DD11]